MEVFYDLHIHSALSPCGENDMTPNNIVNMARIKGLDVIAVCDHNCAENLPAMHTVAQQAGILLIPGMELNTAEEVHLLTYFSDLQTAVLFGKEIYDALPAIKNKPDFFGNQYIMDENDAIIGEQEKLLISSLPFTLDECVEMIRERGGVAVPAHVNKDANSLLANLGFFPDEIDFATIEVSKCLPVLEDISLYNIIHNSDAHCLELISESENILKIEEKSEAEIIKKLGAKKQDL